MFQINVTGALGGKSKIAFGSIPKAVLLHNTYFRGTTGISKSSYPNANS